MSRGRLVITAGAMIAAAGLFTWVGAAQHDGDLPGYFAAPAATPLPDHGPVAAHVRDDAFRRAAVHLDPKDMSSADPLPFAGRDVTCRFTAEAPSGTSPKFSCITDEGETIKVKYGRNPEIQAETAATRLLRRLGFAADEFSIARNVRCYGCPRFPFFTMRVLSLAHAADALGAHGYDQGYTDFAWAGVERKFRAPSIETETAEGWSWWELKRSQAPRADVDALRLAAVFLAHWDNKASNQRLVCLDDDGAVPKDPAHGHPTCERPLLMIQDLGATFGPEKANLARWQDLPVWVDREACRVSMAAMPYAGATFTDAAISEEGRLQLASRLSAIGDDEIRQLFTDARFPELYSGTDDRRDLEAWTAAFKSRVQQIAAAGSCPTAE